MEVLGTVTPNAIFVQQKENNFNESLFMLFHESKIHCVNFLTRKKLSMTTIFRESPVYFPVEHKHKLYNI